jgi:hypothetical protein
MTPEYARGWGQLLPDADAGPGGWSSRDKFAAVLKTAALNEADLAEYCRKRGLFPEQIKAWRVACEQANDWDRSRTAQIGFVDGCISPPDGHRNVPL